MSTPVGSGSPAKGNELQQIAAPQQTEKGGRSYIHVTKSATLESVDLNLKSSIKDIYQFVKKIL